MSYIPDHDALGAEIIISETGNSSRSGGKPIDLLEDGWLSYS